VGFETARPCVFGEAVIGHVDVAQDFLGPKLHGE
jgi:hypothetical protein